MKGRSGMSRGLLALFISLAVHALAAVAIVAYFECGPEPDVLATLDLSSVELSFAEREDETAAVAPSRPSAAQEAPPPKPRTPEPPPSPDKVASAQPPDPSAMKFAEPKEERPEMKTPERPVAVPAAASAPAPEAAPRQAKVEAPPRPRRNIRPEYPKGSRQRGEQGDVLLEIRVDERGAVADVRIVTSSGFSELDAAAVKAARAARFTPARSGGAPVASSARITLAFKLK